MQFLNAQMMADGINQLGDRFDAHAVEKRVLRLHANEFAQELTRYATSNDQLRQFSAAVAKFVDSAFRGQIVQTQKVNSKNLGGECSMNQEWQKTTTPVTAITAQPPATQQDAM